MFKNKCNLISALGQRTPGAVCLRHHAKPEPRAKTESSDRFWHAEAVLQQLYLAQHSGGVKVVQMNECRSFSADPISFVSMFGNRFSVRQLCSELTCPEDQTARQTLG